MPMSLTADLLALPLQSLLPMAPGAQAAGERFGAALTRWIATHPAPRPTATHPSGRRHRFRSIRQAMRSRSRGRQAISARVAAITTLAWAMARCEGAEPVWRAAAAVARSWARVTREAPASPAFA